MPGRLLMFPFRSRRRAAASAVALLAMALVAFGIIHQVRRHDAEPELVPSGPPPTEEQLAARFAPIYRLRTQQRECDRRGEAYVPSPVELVAGGQSSIRLRQPGQQSISGPVVADLAAAPTGSYLDYPGDPRRPGCRYERDARRLGADLEPTVYARTVIDAENEAIVIQYWAFYYFNDWNNTHEGDWEMVQIVFESASLAEAAATGPSYAVYAQHGGGERADWDARKLRKEGDHPVIYVSAGSHASYFSPDTYLGLGEAGAGLGCDVAVAPHNDVRPAVVHLDDAGDGDAWLRFRGRWGQAVGGEFNGPTSPTTKRAWREPLAWAEDARSGSATLPASDLLGIDAVHSLCDAVEIGSRVLRAYMSYPMLVGGAGTLLLAGVSATGLVVLRDSVRSPLVGRETAGFLRRRRSLGQMIRAAAIVYGRFPRLFLGISLSFIPLGIAMSLVQDWFLSLPPLDRLSWVWNANRASQLLLGLLVGGTASLGVYLFVLAGALTAVRSLDAGTTIRVRDAYRGALRRFPALGIARFRTLVPLGLLAISIVGLPVALWLTVRWYFVEEAVLLDGESWWRAPGASSSATEGQWLRSFFLVAFFGALGAFSGPLIAFALLLGTHADPSAVNLVAALFHTAMLPFTAIGLAMAYADLQIRAAERRPETPEPSPTGRLRATHRLGTRVLHLFEGKRRAK